MEKYQPQHPNLTASKTGGIEEHAIAMENMNALTEHQKQVLRDEIKNTIPLIASKNEIAFWCHVQHILEKRNIIKPGTNVYCMYILEKHHLAEKEETGVLDSIKNNLNVD